MPERGSCTLIRRLIVVSLLLIPAGISRGDLVDWNSDPDGGVRTNALGTLIGDLNGDSTVDLTDISILAGEWLDENCDGTDCADFDGIDGVNLVDFAILAGNWEHRPPVLVISEFMPINSYVPFTNPTDIHTTINGQTEYPDWIEIHNTDTDNALDLAGWYLTDDPHIKTKWRFPDTVIPADGYLTVFASLKTQADHPDNYPYVDDEGELHTNFELGGNGDYLALVRPDGVTVEHEYSPEYPKQFGLISFGLDSQGRVGYLKSPTPGSPNTTSWTDVVADTKFSIGRGFYQSGQTLSVAISCSTEDAEIRYTLDGSTPTTIHGSIYYASNPIQITSTTCLRAAAFKTGWLSSNVDTQTYIYLEDVIVQSPNGETPPGWPSAPVNSQVFDYGMDPDIVQSATYNRLMMEAMTAIPSISLVTDMANLTDPAVGIYVNATREGVLWERPVSAELIYPDGTEGFQADAGLRIRGAYSRTGSNPKHSFRLLFKGGYGDTKLEYPVFGDEGPDEFDNVDLRTAQNYAWSNWGNDGSRNTFLRDVYSRDLQREMGKPYTRSRYYHLYLNGQYWGLYQSQERSEASYAETYFGGYKEDYDVIKTDNYGTSFTDGSLDEWNALWYLCEEGFESNDKYYAVLGKDAYGNDDPNIEVHVDLENLIDYMLDIFFAGNQDAPVSLGGTSANNFYAIRNRNPRYRQGWQFFAYDSEHSMLSVNVDRTVTFPAGSSISDFNPQWLHQKLMVNPLYRMAFADRAHKHMFNDGILTTERATNTLLARIGEIDMAIIGESARWGDQRSDRTDNPYTRADWWAEADGFLVQQYLAQRNTVLLNQLKTRQLYPDIEAPVFSRHGGHVATGYNLTMSAPEETIYYTIDGNDPYREVAPPAEGSIVLVDQNAQKYILIPTAGTPDNWTGDDPSYDDSGWNDGVFVADKAGGVGYEREVGNRDYISYNVDGDMYGVNSCAYIRIPFVIAPGSMVNKQYMELRVRYDDGFIAYINGTEVARSDTFTGVPAWNSTAASHEATATEAFDISQHINKLSSRENVLAIHGINSSRTSADFLVWVEMVASNSAPAGDISDSAIVYASPLTLDRSVHVKSRARSQGAWSALNEAVFAVGPVAESLRITELMYHPADSNDAEYIELKNIGDQPINLNLTRFTNGVDFTFSDWILGAGEYVLIVRDRAAMESRYPGASGIIAGQYVGSLENAGERIELVDAAGTVIHDFLYKDGWYDITDGEGFSLTVRDPLNVDPNSYGDKDTWRPSALVDGSPGWGDTGAVPEPGSVVINEVLAHSHAMAPDWIELHNTTGASINIGGWYLSDNDSDDPNRMKYRIADGVSIPANGYVVFYEDSQFNNPSNPDVLIPFALNENGDEVVLSSGQDGVVTGYRDREDFGASPTGVTFGRYYRASTDSYNFVLMSENTPGATNAYPKVGPIVINEIMYNPAGGDQDAEYIELLNITSSPVTLFDYTTAEPWKFTDAIEYTFDSVSPLTVPAGGFVLVVKDPVVFQTTYGEAPRGVRVLTFDSGNLSNGGEKLEISMPGDVDEMSVRQYIRIDRVSYSDGSHPVGEDPWPSTADGGGYSLSRRVSGDYGNDVANWQAGSPTPGRLNTP